VLNSWICKELYKPAEIQAVRDKIVKQAEISRDELPHLGRERKIAPIEIKDEHGVNEMWVRLADVMLDSEAITEKVNKIDEE